MAPGERHTQRMLQTREREMQKLVWNCELSEQKCNLFLCVAVICWNSRTNTNIVNVLLTQNWNWISPGAAIKSKSSLPMKEWWRTEYEWVFVLDFGKRKIRRSQHFLRHFFFKTRSIACLHPLASLPRTMQWKKKIIDNGNALIKPMDRLVKLGSSLNWSWNMDVSAGN